MKSSDSILKIAPAFIKAQKDIKGAAKTAVNPHFKSKYADLAEVMDACLPALNAHGIGVLQPVQTLEGIVVVTTRLIHDSGEWLEEDLALRPQQDTPQAVGSCITYGRRYGLSAMVGVAPEDDDGNAASHQGNGHTSAPAPAPPKGYVKWVDSLYLVADEGTDRLREAWEQSERDLRDYMTRHQAQKWQQIKAAAEKADKDASVLS